MDLSNPFLTSIGFVGLFVFAFVGIWFLVTLILRLMTGMTTKLDVETGTFLRESSWGSAYVNGVNARGCLRVAEYERGWVVRLMWLFGGGKLWLPKEEASISPIKDRTFFRPKSRTIQSGKDRVHLYGDLADFIDQTVPAQPDG